MVSEIFVEVITTALNTFQLLEINRGILFNF